MVTRYGYDVVAAVTGLAVLGTAAGFFLLEGRTPRIVCAGLMGLVFLFTLFFFRDPDRVVPSGENLVLAPADGRIIEIVRTSDPEFLGGEAVQVSIFMSVLDVHVNRFPISGVVRYFRHDEGEYLIASEPKASARNERTHIGIENPRVKVLFRQVAGFIARRIVAEVSPGDHARAGERFGMIKFGSRVDVLLPPGVAVQVRVGDRTVAGETILGVVS
ncbi:MAG: phosphatidylserine decarboxylase family protein [Bacteroidota bacterium]